jgi:hypothetical protein
MEILDEHTVFEKYIKATKSWGVMLSWGQDFKEEDFPEAEELNKACPKLDIMEVQRLYTEMLFIKFDKELEAREFFGTVVGEDGPTKTNPYNGPIKIYSCLFGPFGCVAENS